MLRRDDTENAKRRETYWPAYLETMRHNRVTQGAALGRLIVDNEDPSQLCADELAKLDAFIRRAFDRDTSERQHAAEQDRYRRFARAMPMRALETALEPDETQALRAIRAWEHELATEICVLLGPPGCGKTVAAVAWAWESMPGHTPPRFITGGQLARSSKFGPERDQLLASPALILDDLGVENSPADIDELVDRFYAEQARLVITSNLTPASFAERYGERVNDRLREAGTVITVTGPSMRGTL